MTTSLEDLGAATCKLVNFVDHKVQSPLEVVSWTSRAAVSAKNNIFLNGNMSRTNKGSNFVLLKTYFNFSDFAQL